MLHTSEFQKDVDQPATFLIAFLRRDHTLQGVLLSREKEAEYRLDAAGCTPGGIATLVEVPLGNIDSTRKSLWTPVDDKDSERYGLKDTQLLAIVASEPGKPAPPPTSYPRAELVIVKDQQP